MQVSGKLQKERKNTHIISEFIVGLYQQHTRPTWSRQTKFPCLSSLLHRTVPLRPSILPFKKCTENHCLCSRRVWGRVETANTLWRTKTPTQTQRTLPVPTIWIFTCYSHPVCIKLQEATMVAAFGGILGLVIWQLLFGCYSPQGEM